jgi:hypothetical protein
MRMGSPAVVLVAALGIAGTAHAVDRRLRAERITSDNARELRIGGPDAIGGVDDWYLANDIVEVIVDAPSRRHAKLNHGGTIVDVGLRDRRGEDQFARLVPMLNMSQRLVVGYDAIRAEVDEEAGVARLVVTSSRVSSLPRGEGLTRLLDLFVPEPEALRDVRVETEYAVHAGEPFVRIRTTLSNDGDEVAPIFAYGDLWMRGGRSGRSFVGNTLSPERSRGFHHLSFSRTNLLRSTDAMAAFTHVVVPGLAGHVPITYALFSPERAARRLPFFGVTGEHVSFAVSFVGDPPWEGFGLLRFLRAMGGGMEPGASWVIDRRLLVTGGADVASATDVIFPLLGFAREESGIEGRIEPPGRRVSIQVDGAAGEPVTQVVARSDGVDVGSFRATLPPGDYRLALRTPHAPPRHVEVTVFGERRTVVPPEAFAAPGTLDFTRPFADGGPGRVIVRGRDGTPDPVFGPELLDFRIDGEPGPSATETDSVYFVGNATDPESVDVAPGRYTLTATRGFGWQARTLEVEVSGPAARVVVPPFALERVVDLEGWFAADLHVHAQASDDSGATNRMRLRQFVAEGVQVLVATDHDHVPDYGPALRALDLGDRIHWIRGVEVTSSTPSAVAPWTIGHHNAWPIAWRPYLHRQGAPPSQELSVAELYALLRDDYDARVVQLNHARGKQPGLQEGAFFTHLGSAGRAFDPRLPLDAEPNRVLLETRASDGTRAIDFDVMEVMNGRSHAQYRMLRADWLALLRQGFPRTATANSDTHGPDEPAGWPRNYVWLGADGGGWDAAHFDAALREGRSFGTTGPLVAHFAVNGGRMGDTVPAPEGRILVEFDVDAAAWVPLEEVRLLVNGEVVRIFERSSGFAELRLKRDAFVTLEAGAPLEAEPDTWAAEHPGLYAETIGPGFVPAAFTNPVYVDVDGDGLFAPPGLPPPPPDWQRPVMAVAALLGVGAVGWLRRRRR